MKFATVNPASKQVVEFTMFFFEPGTKIDFKFADYMSLAVHKHYF
jgi:hypothetical protein